MPNQMDDTISSDLPSLLVFWLDVLTLMNFGEGCFYHKNTLQSHQSQDLALAKYYNIVTTMPKTISPMSDSR